MMTDLIDLEERRLADTPGWRLVREACWACCWEGIGVLPPHCPDYGLECAGCGRMTVQVMEEIDE